MLKLGSHVPFKAKNYMLGAAEISVKNGANAAMIYLGAPQNTRRAPIESYLFDEYLKQYSNKLPPENVIVHGPYIVNPANPEKSKFAKEFLIQEVERMETVGLKYLVIHPGSATASTREIAIQTCIDTIKAVIKATNNVEILVETMSGKGNEIGINFDEISQIIKGVNSNRIGICLDTCHLFASGVDILNYDNFINELKDKKFIEKIKCIHVNDSMHEFNTRKDRHANLNEGFIPLKALKNIVHGKDLMHAVKVLETPWVDGKPIYDKEIKLLNK